MESDGLSLVPLALRLQGSPRLLLCETAFHVLMIPSQPSGLISDAAP